MDSAADWGWQRKRMKRTCGSCLDLWEERRKRKEMRGSKGRVSSAGKDWMLGAGELAVRVGSSAKSWQDVAMCRLSARIPPEAGPREHLGAGEPAASPLGSVCGCTASRCTVFTWTGIRQPRRGGFQCLSCPQTRGAGS